MNHPACLCRAGRLAGASRRDSAAAGSGRAGGSGARAAANPAGRGAERERAVPAGLLLPPPEFLQSR